jgi:hypothetical protein
MRFYITGDSPIVNTLKAQFLKEGYIVTRHFPHFTIELEKGYKEEPGGKIIDGRLKFFSCDGELERLVLRHFCSLSNEPLLLHRGEGQFEIKIQVPQRFEDEISHSILRAVNELVHVKISWFRRWLSK